MPPIRINHAWMYNTTQQVRLQNIQLYYMYLKAMKYFKQNCVQCGDFFIIMTFIVYDIMMTKIKRF